MSGSSYSGVVHLQRIADTGEIDGEAHAWLAHTLKQWFATGGDGNDLLRRLRIPTTKAKRQKAARDFWLAAAADQLDRGPAQLAAAADRFERRLWPLWCGLAVPPSHADAVDGCLFFARRAAPLPTSAKQCHRILGTFSAKRVQDDRP